MRQEPVRGEKSLWGQPLRKKSVCEKSVRKESLCGKEPVRGEKPLCKEPLRRKSVCCQEPLC